ncbi:NADPH-dependent F420 reductase [Streptomyces sp. NBC_01304]|uniref:NADPH-dependent F420 reductase n=1 Tax=Streptomyces sp. NBC_01304 TaxID=2903818 RepID=UPI002E1246D0|nr:NAD(P)-binding domain-containing protein [Streptomyces sp. NBC_01304]
MRIGILGTGNVGKAVAAGAAAAGHDVMFGSRDPKGRADALDLPVVPHEEAAAHGEIVVNATGGNASLDLLPTLAEPLAGKVLLDIAIDLTPDLDLAHLDISQGEKLQKAMPGVRVVKTLCTMDSVVMVDPLRTLPEPGTVFLSGDDAAAKEAVGALLGDLGWPPETRLDLGGIGTARGQEHAALLFMGVGHGLGSYHFNFKVVPPKPEQA